MIREFASLHNHSHFSTMDGISRPDEIVLAAKQKGLKAVALTEHGHLHSMADFYLAGKKHGVRTVFGMEAYVIHDLEEWNLLKAQVDEARKLRGKGVTDAGEEISEEMVGKEQARKLRKKGHLVLLACNQEGLTNVYQLTFKAHKYGFYGKPRIDKQMLREHVRGLVATSACMGGVISNKCWELKRGHCEWSEVVREAKEFDEIFGRGRFFLELQFNESDSQRYINDCMVKIHQETGIPLTVTTDSHYVDPNDWETQEILYMLRGNKTLATRGPDWDFEIKQLYLKGAEEMWDSFLKFGGSLDPKIAMQAFQNTLLIEGLVEQFDPDTHQRLPTLPYQNPFKEMGERALDELKRRGLDKDERYVKRLMHELKVIKEKGIANYFLITRQIIQKAKEQMLVGAGRGSAAGSLTCYMLGITDLDPIAMDLMFERFLDPDRVELPDIDVDFEDADQAKEMLRQMFGEDNVACLSSYGTFQIKGLLKDLARVYDLDHNEVNRLNKRIESELRVLYANQDKSTIVIKLDDIERVSPSFNTFVEQNPQIGRHLKQLYGRVRHASRHAAGVIIGDNLPAETALWVSKGVVQASFTEGIVNKNISAMGFVKFDILSIATLKVINHALKLIAAKTGRDYKELEESIRPHNMDLNDQKVLRNIFWDGNFAGIFQFTEKGIRKLAMQVKPDSFDDVAAVTALYRPGPLGSGMDKLFVENKFNPDNVSYDHPLLENVLSYTRGCVVYQEQLMEICRVLGKMSMKDVNRVRKVLLKKDKSKSEEFLKKEGDELRGKFVTGCEENGLTEKAALEWWEKLLKFGGYGFNKAHSYSYAVMTMQAAYLATYHPLEFYSAVLTCAQAGDLQSYVTDITKAGVKILPVDINASKAAHVVEDGKIRLSFRSVLGVGPSAIEKIVENQPYHNFMDFLERSKASKTAVMPLIQVDAFSSLDERHANTKALQSAYEAYLANSKFRTKKGRPEWERAFNLLVVVNPIDDYQPHEKVFFETELLGFSVRGSPFEILDRDRKIQAVFGDTITDYKEFIEGEEQIAMLPVLVKEFKERAQRNGQMMAFVKFGTPDGDEFEAPCFSAIWRHIGQHVKKGGVYIATFNRREDEPLSLIIGRPGFQHSAYSSAQYMINVDSIQI